MSDPNRTGPRRPDRQTPDGGKQAVLERKPKTKRPKLYRVIVHNDDYTTMEFVVWVLQVVFHKTETEATHLMLSIHHKGKGIAGVFTRDLAETKAARAMAEAEDQGMPLQVTTEPED
ncbi:MAG: ATP-dependent Clp protease adaptor ClpS [Proteobacteria bacterium]|nr:MAG: ATP-dependent Clp protease adaptor ClpS [Pseudomonadota bacterium]